MRLNDLGWQLLDEATKVDIGLFFNNISLNDIKVLAEYEIPDSDQVLTLVKETRFQTLPQLNMKLPLVYSAITVQGFIIVCMLYFSLFLREAKLSSRFPSRGTLFSVFSNSITSKVMFIVLLFVPVTSSILLGMQALEDSKWLAACAAVVLCVTFIILRDSVDFLRTHTTKESD